MNNSAQLEDRKLRLLVFLLKNPLKLCKTVRNEEATVRPWERQWNCVTHSETMRVERSVITVGKLCCEFKTVRQKSNL